MRAGAIAALFLACSSAPARPDAGQCSPALYRLCIIPEPPIPPSLWPWHCTDGAARGRAWCAVCFPPAADYCAIDDAPGAVVCVSACAMCQVPGWPACRPEWTDDLGIADLSEP